MVTWLDMLKGRTRKQVPAAQVLPYVGFAVLFFLFIWRAFRGFDWSDESAAFAAPYRLLLGDLPLVDSWDSHPGWLVLAAPFLKLYQNWQGNMDGVLLAGRLCFAAVQIFVSVIVYHRLFLFCKSHLASMLAGWLTASFVPGMVLNFSAQSVSLLAMVLFAGLRGKLENNKLVPEAFKGAPITLVTASILSLSFMGFSGMVDGIFA